MAVFDWMWDARSKANADPEYRKLGSADAVVYFQSGKHCRRISFEDFEIASPEEVSLEGIADQDILISMTTREWNSYLYQRKLGRAPSLIGLESERLHVIKTKNSMARLQFERISRSVQAFVDYGARVSGK